MMRLVRFGPPGRERPGALERSGIIRDYSSVVSDWAGTTLDPDNLRSIIAHVDAGKLPVVETGARLGSPVGSTRKIIGVGLNYADHAAEANLPIPDEPVWFMKATSAISGPNDPVIIPDGSTQLDWEVELAFVIGKRATYVPEEQAWDHIAGFTIMNDVSEREFQLQRGGQWTKGKSCDSFAPLGPWLLVAEKENHQANLPIWLDVNSERMQSSNTSNLIFGLETLVASLSRYMTLEPGDIISTGTPAGVGFARKPQRFLQPGDEMTLGIEGLGVQRQKVIRRAEFN